MSWKIALVVALISGIITAAVTAPVADKLTSMHGVSNFEGQRGMLVAFILIPAGFLGGAVLGLLATRFVGATEWAHFWKAAGLAVLLGQAGILGIAGLSLLSAPRPPLLEGSELALEVEVYVPLHRVTPRSREPYQIRLSLYAGPKDHGYAQIDRSLFREEDGHLIVTAVAPLNSASYRRSLSFHIEEHTWATFDLAALPATPAAGNLEWTALAPLRNEKSQTGTDATSDIRLRYRVIKATHEGSTHLSR